MIAACRNSCRVAEFHVESWSFRNSLNGTASLRVSGLWMAIVSRMMFFRPVSMLIILLLRHCYYGCTQQLLPSLLRLLGIFLPLPVPRRESAFQVFPLIRKENGQHVHTGMLYALEMSTPSVMMHATAAPNIDI